jgi:hypothetical protein
MTCTNTLTDAAMNELQRFHLRHASLQFLRHNLKRECTCVYTCLKGSRATTFAAAQDLSLKRHPFAHTLILVLSLFM